MITWCLRGALALGCTQSGQFIGILKQMLDTMNSDLKDATDVENAAMKVFEKLLAAMTKQIEAVIEKIEDKLQRIGTTGLI